MVNCNCSLVFFRFSPVQFRSFFRSYGPDIQKLRELLAIKGEPTTKEILSASRKAGTKLSKTANGFWRLWNVTVFGMVVPHSTDPIVQQGASIFFGNPRLEDALQKKPAMVCDLIDRATVAVKNKRFNEIPDVLHGVVDIIADPTLDSHLAVPAATTSNTDGLDTNEASLLFAPAQQPPATRDQENPRPPPTTHRHPAVHPLPATFRPPAARDQAARHQQLYVMDESEDEDKDIPWPPPPAARRHLTAHAPPATRPLAVGQGPPAAACYRQLYVPDESEDKNKDKDEDEATLQPPVVFMTAWEVHYRSVAGGSGPLSTQQIPTKEPVDEAQEMTAQEKRDHARQVLHTHWRKMSYTI
ncbi:hypothetical protein DXG01_002777 [Tephrocybe rancida]|nr:hypothetical protein DXG01_002777 [Tephrocybe rancida]